MQTKHSLVNIDKELWALDTAICRFTCVTYTIFSCLLLKLVKAFSSLQGHLTSSSTFLPLQQWWEFRLANILQVGTFSKGAGQPPRLRPHVLQPSTSWCITRTPFLFHTCPHRWCGNCVWPQDQAERRCHVHIILHSQYCPCFSEACVTYAGSHQLLPVWMPDRWSCLAPCGCLNLTDCKICSIDLAEPY